MSQEDLKKQLLTLNSNLYIEINDRDVLSVYYKFSDNNYEKILSYGSNKSLNLNGILWPNKTPEDILSIISIILR